VLPGDVSHSLLWFPLVGTVLGALLTVLDAMLRQSLADPVVNAALVAALVVMSGGLHLDGLIDAADGLTAPGGADERLRAMRQSTAGPAGAVAGVLALLGTFAAIAGLAPEARSVALFLSGMRASRDCRQLFRISLCPA